MFLISKFEKLVWDLNSVLIYQDYFSRQGVDHLIFEGGGAESGRFEKKIPAKLL